MIGGYQILDLRGIDLQISGSASNITDPYVLKQLLQLRDHIDKAYDFKKPLVNQLKPVLVRFRDKKNGEKTEGATFGEMSVVGNYYTFKITGRISGQFTLIINVAFHEVTNAYGNKEWLINTATIQLADASNVLEGDIAIDGDLSVSGDVTVGENSKVKILENIVDKAGNPRFIEGDITPISALEAVVPYAKWSLSGSHLMLVLCIYNTTEEDITISGASSLGDASNLPQWIKNKIYPMGNTPHVVHNFAVEGVKPDDLTQDSNKQATYLIKATSSSIAINGVNFTAKAGYYYRIEFDLLIDDNYE